MKKIVLAILCALALTFTMSAKNRALLIGVGGYNTSATGWGKISSVNDIDLLKPKFVALGYEVSSLTDAEATKAKVVSALKVLSGKTVAGDNIYLHFSGHGQLIEDLNGDEFADYDQSFVCFDACLSSDFKSGGRAYRGQNHLIDDELFPILSILKQKVGSNGSVMVVFDSCYSGGADRGEQDDDPDPDSEVEWSETVRGTGDEFKANASADTYLRKLKVPGEYTRGGGTLTVISACEADKRNYECRDKRSGKAYGSLSYAISKLIDTKVPMSEWGKYFTTRKYVKDRIFRRTQRPVVEIH